MSCRQHIAAIVVVLAGALSLGGLVHTAPATAAPGDLTCISTDSSATFDPPLTLTSRRVDVAFENVLNNCVSTTGVPLTSAVTEDVIGSGSANCLALGNLEGTGKFRWDTGQVSEFTWETTLSTVTPTAATFVFTGTVTSGPLAGKTVQGVAPPVPLNIGDCLTSGMDSLNYAVVWTFA